MPLTTSLGAAITNALAPGVALTSGIIYYNGLQVRLNVISGRVRELDREARGLDPERDAARLDSVFLQVRSLARRSQMLQAAVLVCYAGLVSFILTMLELLLIGLLEIDEAGLIPAGTFFLGLCAFAGGMIVSILEMFVANRTLLEDVRSSFPGRH